MADTCPFGYLDAKALGLQAPTSTFTLSRIHH